ncbi:MAG: GreA/GreB family elongation factor [Chthoniobacterales bacterium]
MSRAFIKEDIDPPERKRRPRAASGLPPGATNYITTRGAQRLRKELSALRRAAPPDEARIAELEKMLASVTVVEPEADPATIAFGARVTVRDEAGEERAYRIVGIDELDFYPDAVSWISRNGKTLLAAEPGDRVALENETRGKVVAVDYPAG